MKIHDVTIIGAGPAGIAAAIQLKRYGIDPLLLEAHRVGGLLWNANLVENYPGFPNGIPGPELVKLFQAQLEESGVHVHKALVCRLSFSESEGLFLVETTNEKFHSKLAIVATGTKPEEYPLAHSCPSEAKERIYYEVYPLLGLKGKKIVIIGAGDAAFDYALNLARSNEVVILNRSKRIKALPLLVHRVSTSPRIAYRENTEVVKIMADADGLRLECTDRVGRFILKAHHLLCALGRRPRLELLDGDLRLKVKGRGLLYFIGDAKNGHYRQTAIAVGDGIHAAMRAYKRLKAMP